MQIQRKIFIIILLLLFLSDRAEAGAVGGFGQKSDAPRPSFSVEILPWQTVKDLIPNKSYFTIIDVRTGLSFDVQRRAGSKHADVQPLTNEDTKVMKKIYGGTWSWDRRAILVQYKDRLIPGSMNGMPHGAGALQNGFPGHFCVHFYGSTTHKTPTPDLAHKLMILRAGGELERYVYYMDPYESLSILEVAINQHDDDLLALILSGGEKGIAKKMIHDIKHIDISDLSLLPSEDLHPVFCLTVHAKLKWITEGKVQNVKKGELIIRRNSPEDQWGLDAKALGALLQ
ncbi:hypothetical protein BHE18_05600 [Rossellomorea aquimaris]|jgi:hypothetical protein|uniref:Uncharacterized protein n=1 Tax=Rossellomorea aquimaris TaxID=189382 RepID=A0A1J6W643_9BACI|nr:hypothetical protein [Rossellomorea aquimaris]OIU72108.1 hypothetical protein BHE18_05600 [Rossellomorea aquimaris]